MLIFYADKHQAHSCAGEIKDGELKPCFENPTRAEAIERAFSAVGYSDVRIPEDHVGDLKHPVHDPQTGVGQIVDDTLSRQAQPAMNGACRRRLQKVSANTGVNESAESFRRQAI